MKRREAEQFKLFETGLFLVGGTKCYLLNIRRLLVLLPESERDITRAIDLNVTDALKQVARAQIAASELSDCIGYKYLRKKEK